MADVLNSRMIAYPFRLLQCCLVTDGGGALILTSADRAKDFSRGPSASWAPARAWKRRWSARWRPSIPRRVQDRGPLAFKEAGIAHKDVDHLMIYDAFASAAVRPRRLGFTCRMRKPAKFIADGNMASGLSCRSIPQWRRPVSTMHSGMYGMKALQESVAVMRGIAAGAGAERREDFPGLPRRHGSLAAASGIDRAKR